MPNPPSNYQRPNLPAQSNAHRPRVHPEQGARNTASPGRKPELLAPVGNLEAFYCAIQEGADAVYAGAPGFNARLRAKNFTLDELSRMLAYAHERGRKLYVALNTLVFEKELPELVRTLDALRRAAPDALIVQDMGVFRLARELAPEIPLHASTQLTVHNLDGALTAERLGFERVILARELTMEEIRYIRGGCRVGLECFIHGAMCYSISGQCYMSGAVHEDASANRGRCMQPCRRLYRSAEGLTPLFSPSDLSAAPIFSQILTLGLESFKIEGRLKAPEAIGRIVRAYRLLIDAWPIFTAELIAEARGCLDLAIGRKSSTGFFQTTKPYSRTTEKETQAGRLIGEVLTTGGDRFQIQPTMPVKAGDRLRVQMSRNEAPQGFTVREIHLTDRVVKRCGAGRKIWLEAPFTPPIGAEVVKVADADALIKGSRGFEEKEWPRCVNRSRMAIPATWTDSPVAAIDAQLGPERFRVEQGPSNWESVPESEARSILEAESSRTGLRLSLTNRLDRDFPLGVAALEGLRERILAQALRRLDKRRDQILEELATPLPAPERSLEGIPDCFVRFGGLDEAGTWLEREDVACVVPLAAMDKAGVEKILAEKTTRERLFLEIPAFVFGEDQERLIVFNRIRKAARLGLKRFVVSNIYAFGMFKRLGVRGLTIVMDATSRCLNSENMRLWEELGVAAFIYSIEGDTDNLKALLDRAGTDRILVQVYGSVPLFRSRQPWPKPGAATPEGAGFPLRVEKMDGLTVVLAEKPLDLRRSLPDFQKWGLRRFLHDMDWTRTPPQDVSKILGTPASSPRP